MNYIKINKVKRNLNQLVDDKWKGIEETFYLYNIKGLVKILMIQIIIKILKILLYIIRMRIFRKDFRKNADKRIKRKDKIISK